jgi:hypothetical protein
MWNLASKVSEHSSFFPDRLSNLLRFSTAKNHENCAFPAPLIVQTYLEACTEAEAVRQAFPSISSIASFASVDAEQAKRLVFRVVFARVDLLVPKWTERQNLFPMASDEWGFTCDRQSCRKLLDHFCLIDGLDCQEVLGMADCLAAC